MSAYRKPAPRPLALRFLGPARRALTPADRRLRVRRLGLAFWVLLLLPLAGSLVAAAALPATRTLVCTMPADHRECALVSEHLWVASETDRLESIRAHDAFMSDDTGPTLSLGHATGTTRIPMDDAHDVIAELDGWTKRAEQARASGAPAPPLRRPLPGLWAFTLMCLAVAGSFAAMARTLRAGTELSATFALDLLRVRAITYPNPFGRRVVLERELSLRKLEPPTVDAIDDSDLYAIELRSGGIRHRIEGPHGKMLRAKTWLDEARLEAERRKLPTDD